MGFLTADPVCAFPFEVEAADVLFEIRSRISGLLGQSFGFGFGFGGPHVAHHYVL